MRSLLDDYATRLGHYCRFHSVELVDGADKEVVAAIERATKDAASIVALEVDGVAWASARLARFVEQCEVGAVTEVAFLIGGSYGLPKVISQRANVRLSLSPMTLPHRIARLVLVEQLYRAFTILRNEPYSH